LPNRLYLGRLIFIAVAVAIAAGALASRVSLLSTRRFDPDELEHAHVAWSISQGRVPYRDFFEMHPPVFHYLVAPLIARLDVRSPDGAMHALFALRKAMWALSVGIVLCTFVLARRLGEVDAAWASLPILATDIVLAHRGIEIRPDGLATVAWLGSLAFMLAGLRSSRPGSRATRSTFAASGLCIGLGVLTSQKLLLAGPSLLITLAWYVSSATFGATTRVRIRNAAWQAVGCLVPWLGALVLFAFHQSAGVFLHSILLQDLGWRQEATVSGVLTFVSHYDPWLFALAAGGACLFINEALTDSSRRVPNTFLLLNTAGVFLGLFAIPVPFPQYCLTFIPLLAILGAGLLVRCANALCPAKGSNARPESRMVWTIAIAIFCVLAAVGLRTARPVVLSRLLYPTAIFGAGLVMIVLARRGQRELALSAALLALALYPAQWTTWMRAEGDGGQFAALRFVEETTNPSSLVMDGWSGLGVFRQHAWYYWMLHPGVRAMLSHQAIDGLESELISGRIRPDVVVLDPHLRALSDNVTRYVELHYRASGVGDVYLAR
jgi:hypothetical protein